MSTLPGRARAVVIGAGIVGNSVAYHLHQQGWTDLVLIDKGPFPNPGGSTGHASNFIFPVDHSKEMTALTADSVRQYRDLGVFTQSGGIEVARTEERMQELRRRMSSAGSWGIDGSSLVTPAEIRQMVPFIDESILVGGFFTPTVGVVDSLRAGTLMRERAQEAGALTAMANTEVLGIDVEHGRVQRVRTTRGDIEAEIVVIACGVWSPKLARMAGASIPLTPAVHQMIDVGPVPRFADAKSHIDYPIVRDMDTNMYERQDGAGLEIGSYAHRPILHDPEEIPSVEEAALSPTEFPFTQADFEQQMEHALELMPEIVGDETVGVKYAINGILSLTPDGLPVLGETPEVKGLWSVAAVWVKEGPGIGRAVSEWMAHGESEIDLHSSDIARFWEHQKTRAHVRARAAEGFNKTYGIVHPGEQWASNRDVRLAPFHARERELGAVFFEAAGWERPQWYESNAPLLEEYGDRVSRREAEWDARWWSPIINAEHLALRDRAGMVDLTAFAMFDISGPGALEARAGRGGAPDGRADRTGGLHAHPRLRAAGSRPISPSCASATTCSASSPAALTAWPTASGSRTICRPTARRSSPIRRRPGRRSACGARAPATSWRRSRATTSLTRASGSARAATIEVDTLRVLASRISYVGDLGWELYVPIEQGAKLWDLRLGSGPAARHRRRSGSASTAPPAGSRSATAPTASSSRASTTCSRRGCPGRR